MFAELEATIHHPTNTILFQFDQALGKDNILRFCNFKLEIYEHIAHGEFFVIQAPNHVILAKTYFEGRGISWDENDPQGKNSPTLKSSTEIKNEVSIEKQKFNWDQHKGFL